MCQAESKKSKFGALRTGQVLVVSKNKTGTWYKMPGRRIDNAASRGETRARGSSENKLALERKRQRDVNEDRGLPRCMGATQTAQYGSTAISSLLRRILGHNGNQCRFPETEPTKSEKPPD